MSTTVNVQEAKTQLSRLLNLIEAGDEVTISRRGEPVAKLVRAGPQPPKREPGTWRGRIWMSDDFDDELPEEWFEPLEP